MKSVEMKLDRRSCTMSDRMALFASVPLVATRVRIEKTRSASDTERVPSAESFRPRKGRYRAALALAVQVHAARPD